MSSTPDRDLSHWPHRWACALACATFVLVSWGGFVTASGSGMAFRDWLTSDGVLMPLYPWLSSTGDKFVEHGHRLLGMLAGGLTMALVASIFLAEPRRWVRLFSVALLVGVIAQGVLGGVRVTLDAHSPAGARAIALLHGCTGPLFFAACAVMATVTSPRWRSVHVPRRGAEAVAGMLRLAVLTAVISYLQLILGAIVRHSPLMAFDGAERVFQIAVYFHVLLAVAVTVHVLVLSFRCLAAGLCPALAAILALLVGVQLLLGATTWLAKYGMPRWAIELFGERAFVNAEADLARAAILTAHGAVGALIVAVCVVLALRIGRLPGVQSLSSTAGAPRLAGGLA